MGTLLQSISIRHLASLGLAATLLSTSVPVSAQDTNPWGIRNIRLLDEWNPAAFGVEFGIGRHEPGPVGLWLFWEEVEPNDPCSTPLDFQTEILDGYLDLIQAAGGFPNIVFHPTTIALGGGGMPWGLVSDPVTGQLRACDDPAIAPAVIEPCDLDPNPPVIYSQRLRDVAFALADHVRARGFTTAYFRFFNEAWGDWPLVPGARKASLWHYMRAYLSFRRGVLDAEAPGYSVFVSHGSIPRTRVASRELVRMANEGEITQAEAWTRLDALIERNRCGVGSSYPMLADDGGVAHIDSWEDAVAFGGPVGPQNQRGDLWLDHYIDCAATSTTSGHPIFDFTTFHPHDKPVDVHMTRETFDRDVVSQGGTPVEWVGGEVAVYMPDQVNWGYVTVPGAQLDQFLTEDLARKWVLLLANTKGFCASIRAGGYQYRSLYRSQPQPQTTCPLNWSITQPLDPFTAVCSGSGTQCIHPDPANQAFLFLRGTIGDSFDCETLGTPDQFGGQSHYRFDTATGYVDVIWRNEMYDATTTVSDVLVQPPPGFQCGDVYDVLGNHVGIVGMMPGKRKLQDLGQAPRVIVWACPLPGF